MIYVTNLNNQLNITYDTRKDVYAFDSIKSVSFSWDTIGNYYVAINFIANDKNNSLRVYLKDVDPTLTWTNDLIGATLAVNTIASWMNQVIEVNLDAANDQVGIYGYVNGASGSPVPLNVNATGQVAIQDGGNSITIDATSLPLPTGAATETTLGDIKTSIQLIDDCVGTDGVAAPTNSFVIAGVTAGGIQQTIEVNASGHVNISDGGGSITVDGLFFQAIQPVNQVEKTGTSGYTAAITGVAATDVIIAPGVGLFTYVTQILVTNSHATVGTLVTIQTEDGTGLYAGYAGPAGGGFSVSFTVPIKMPVANKKLQAICTTTGANVYVSASGYIAA